MKPQAPALESGRIFTVKPVADRATYKSLLTFESGFVVSSIFMPKA